MDEYTVVRSKSGGAKHDGYWRVRRNGKIVSEGFVTKAEAVQRLVVIRREMQRFPVNRAMRLVHENMESHYATITRRDGEPQARDQRLRAKRSKTALMAQPTGPKERPEAKKEAATVHIGQRGVC